MQLNLERILRSWNADKTEQITYFQIYVFSRRFRRQSRLL